MELQLIENILCEHSLVAQGVVVGNEQPYLSVIIVPDFVALKNIMSDDGHVVSLELDDKKLVKNLEARRYFCDIIHGVNKRLVETKKIERFSLLTVESEEQKEVLDNREKLYRIINENHRNIIESFYQEIPPGIG